MENPSDFGADETANEYDETKVVILGLDEDVAGRCPTNEGGSKNKDGGIVSSGEKYGGSGAEEYGDETLGDISATRRTWF